MQDCSAQFASNIATLLVPSFIFDKRIALCKIGSNINPLHPIFIKAIKTIKALHNTKPFLQNFDMFKLIDYYLRLLKRRKIELPKFIDKYSKTIDSLGKILAQYRNHLVPCHNDIVPENIINSHHKIYLVDFDYSGNNDFCFDLGNLSVEMGYNENQVKEKLFLHLLFAAG